MLYAQTALRLTLLLACSWLRLAADVSVSVSLGAAPSPVTLSETLTYAIGVSNVTATPLVNLAFTNTLPASVTLLGATNTQGGITNAAGALQFFVPLLAVGQSAQFAINVRPTTPGTLTNVLTANVGFTNATTTNTTALTNLTQVFAGRIDLAVGLTGPTGGILTNDFVSYQLTLTNLGPQDAVGVTLTNFLPAGTGVRSVSAADQAYSVTADGLVFTVDSLAVAAGRLIAVNLQFTNAGAFTLRAVVGAANYYDNNSANDSATLSVTVDLPVAADLGVAVLSAQQFNPQTGLFEQKVRLTNNGTNAVARARVRVDGLTNRLVSAVGTNAGVPFVTLAGGLAVGASVDLLLEYFSPSRQAVGDPVLSALAVPAFASVLPGGTGVAITRILVTAADQRLLEFPSVSGHSYTILYGDNILFTNALAAQPSVIAPADRVQWIDTGPPKTISSPSNAPVRFYRVIESP